MDDLGFEQAVDCLGQGIVIAVADAAHRWFDASFRQPLAVTNAQILRAPVAMMNQPHALSGPTIMHRLFQSIEHEPCMRRRADTPADDLAGVCVDDEGRGPARHWFKGTARGWTNPFQVAT